MRVEPLNAAQEAQVTRVVGEVIRRYGSAEELDDTAAEGSVTSARVLIVKP